MTFRLTDQDNPATVGETAGKRQFSRRCLLGAVSSVSVASMLSLAGCAQGSNLPWLPDPTAAGYRLGTGDQVRVIVFGEDQLSDAFRVDEAGMLTMPLIGSIRVADLTTNEVATQIAAALLAKSVLRDANVTVEMIAYRPFFILGEVAHPGQYPYQPRITMLTAVAVAGGFTYRAIKDYAGVVRVSNGTPEHGRIEPQGLVAPGDVIDVFQRYF
jgi:polysaccharide export outer membrane protein